ncbi:MAG: 16S rRNA (cytidine(1402)-2'-O)-methyltransferase [Oscillatoriales cyanobacterium SM2_2_1]|nr:16S rRNA (cytidine(1402)-2'-O)-methyltransferase [Oscillatoriales cyanobacterium SM2_2_1]
MAGRLYLVGTPIGNLEDMTFRAVETLRAVDLIAAEDTRHTGKLLLHFGIGTPQISYHEHNRMARTPELITHLQRGTNIALVTDAGMPAISDPGQELVRACLDAELPVIPIPGGTAGITALVASGMATERFVFEGFLPSEPNKGRDRLQQLIQESRTLIFYEAPHRLLATLERFAEAFSGDRPITVARELTKRHEEFWRGTLREAIAHFSARPPKGEFTLVLAGKPPDPKPQWNDAQLRIALLELMQQQGMSRSQASRSLADLTALPHRRLYQLSLDLPVDHIG